LVEAIEGDNITSSDAVAKLAQAWSRLRNRRDDSALLVFYALAESNEEASRASLHRPVATVLPTIEVR
jgi:hypothetical protein